MTDEEEKKVNQLLQYDMMGEATIPQTAGWGTSQSMNTQNIMEPIIPNPAPEDA